MEEKTKTNGKLAPFLEKMDKFFKITERGSNWRREIIGGLVTFLAMCYILAVNPGMLSGAPVNMPYGGVFLATALIAGFATIAMGVFAKMPMGLAPGMGTNAFFAYSVVGAMGYSWQEALAAGVLGGVLFLILSITKIRTKILEAVPKNLRLAIGAGIGFFIAYIGLRNMGIITFDVGAKLTGLTDFNNPMVWLAVLGLVIAMVLHARGYRYTLIVSILVTAVVGVIVGEIFINNEYMIGADFFNGVVGATPNFPLISTAKFNYTELGDIKITASGFVEGFASKNLWTPQIIMVIITFAFVDMFDTMGTFLATAGPAGLIREDGTIEGAEKGMIVDATATVIGNMLGTPVTTTYVESSAGIAAGARSGFASVVTGSLFLLSILLFPIFQIFSHPAVTGMALVLVGVLMATQLKNIEWDKPEVAIFAFMTIIIMVLSYSIANGIAFGFIFYVITMMAQKRFKEVHPVAYGLAGFFVIYYMLQAIF
ncbi:MAG: NCS2 family permease [Acholeplasmataceae bacterium]|jgi:AGZA family xanthine/uracil permease-like MFS transporter